MARHDLLDPNMIARRTTMRFALRAAAAGKLEDVWLYLPTSEKPTLDTPCLLVEAGPDGDSAALAAEHGFHEVGLDTSLIEGAATVARGFRNPPGDELLLESFTYYWRFDAWLPSPGAPDPPPPQETAMRRAREFFEVLGEERPDVACRSEGCARGAIHQSVFCRVHHYEMIRKEPCPFLE